MLLLGDYDSAAQAAYKALLQDPQNGDAKLVAGEAEAAKGNHQIAADLAGSIDMESRLGKRAVELHHQQLIKLNRFSAAADVLLAARRAGVYHRRYDALTLSAPAEDEGAWEWAIATHARDKRMRVALIATDTPRGAGAVRDSRTRFRVDARGPLGARLALFPETGRTHQLRVHALAAGAGLFGDRVYRCPTRATCPDGRVITARRVMLHCALLRLPDVAADDPEAPPLEITAAWPTDFRRAADGLGVGAPGPSVSA